MRLVIIKSDGIAIVAERQSRHVISLNRAPHKEEDAKSSLSVSSNGAGDRGRTDTVSLPRDFESRASANSTTPATYCYIIVRHLKKIKLFSFKE